MRIHGDEKIKRRDNIAVESDFHKYAAALSDDFCHICGYCGKSEMVTTKGFEIDHFVPRTTDPKRETDYYNLVYSCFSCNRKKWGKWPTKDKNLTHNGIEGFIDPATNEYDDHLERNDFGDIVYKTAVGKYMCEKAFKFDQRPMKTIWKYMQILKKQKLIEDRTQTLSSNDLMDYIELNKAVKELHKYLFSKKE